MKIGAQLYTVRDHVKTAEGLQASLTQIAQMGYEGVQVSAVEAFLSEVSAKQLRKWLDELGLVCCATHRPWDRLAENLSEEIDIHLELGCRVIGIGMAPKVCLDGGHSAWRSWLGEVNKLVEELAKHNLVFAYHNHAIEWERKDGERAIDILASESHELMQFILDTYWVQHSGACSIDYIEQLRGRVDVVHLKDKSVHGWETRYAPVGEGNIAWHRILPSLNDAGTEWWVVEQDDCYGESPFECLKRSIGYLKSL